MGTAQLTLEEIASPLLARIEKEFAPAHPDWASLLTDAKRRIIKVDGNAPSNLGFKKDAWNGLHAVDIMYLPDGIKFSQGVSSYHNEVYGFYIGAGIITSDRSKYKHYRVSTKPIIQDSTVGYVIALGNETEPWNINTKAEVISPTELGDLEKAIRAIRAIRRIASKEMPYRIDLTGVEYKKIEQEGTDKIMEAIKLALKNKSITVNGLMDLAPELYTPIRQTAFELGRELKDLGLMDLSPPRKQGKKVVYVKDGVVNPIREK